MSDDTTTPIPAEAIEAFRRGTAGSTAYFLDEVIADGLAAAAPALLATERERIATAIEADCKHTALIGLDVCERCEQAARTARTTTEENHG